MASSAPLATIIVIDLAEHRLLENLSRVHQTLAKCIDDPISVYIYGDTDGNPLSSVLESVALRAMIGILRNDVHRIEELSIETEYRSSLRGISALVSSLSRLLFERTMMAFNVDDCPEEA